MSFTITYNGVTDKSIGAHARTRPSIPAPQKKATTYQIAGHDGDYYDFDGCREDIQISIQFGFVNQDWHAGYRALKNWLFASGNGRLSFSNQPGYHYRVKNVMVDPASPLGRRIGSVGATFVCDGYTYLDSGSTQISLASTISNPGAICHPIYTVTGNGTCTLTVNGKTFVVTVGTSATIDTEKMITYNAQSAWANTTVVGDYEDLYLEPGSNSLSATSGFTVKLIPNWRCL